MDFKNFWNNRLKTGSLLPAVLMLALLLDGGWLYSQENYKDTAPQTQIRSQLSLQNTRGGNRFGKVNQSLEDGHAQYRRIAMMDGNLVTGPGHRTMQSHARKAYRTVFPDIRSIRPPDSLNEILVGGRNLRPPRVIRAAGAAWCDPEDRRHWARLRVTRLVKGPRHPSPGGPGRGSA